MPPIPARRLVKSRLVAMPGRIAARLAAAILAFNAAPALALEDDDFGPLPMTPVIGVIPAELSFAQCLEPNSDCDERTFELFNDVSDPSSMLQVIGITLAGDYTLLGPEPPLTIPGDGTRIPYTVRFCPSNGLPAPGVITITALLAANSPRILPLSGDGNQPPVCDAGGPYLQQMGPPVMFNGTQSEDPDPEGRITSYAWDFGDGATGTGPRPTHAYTAVGTYAVSLTISDNCGSTASCSTTAIIAVGNMPPICDAGGPYSGFNGLPIQFDGRGSSDPDGVIASYFWNFGDGVTGVGPTPTHSYVSPGIYSVQLRVTDQSGLFTTCSVIANVALNELPICDPGGPYQGTAGVPVQFDGTGSFDPDGVIVSYRWTFGDGATSTSPSPLHTYAAPGNYPISLTLRDDRGATSSCATVATILFNQPPACDAGGPYLAAVGASIHFDGTGSDDPDGTIVSYAWNFGDGSTGTGATPTHSYAATGDYVVQLCLEDDRGATTCCFTSARVLGGGSPLTPVIAVDPTLLDFGNCNATATPVDRTIQVHNGVFDPTSILHVTAVAVAGAPFTLLDGPGLPLDLPGDGTHATFTLRFVPPGTQLAVGSCTITAPGASNSPLIVPLQGRANVAPLCDAGGPYAGTTAAPIQFDGTGSQDPGGITLDYHWSFGDGTTGSGPEPLHTYTMGGTFQVVLTLTDNCQVTTSCTTTASIVAAPICNAGGPYGGMPGIPVTFNGSGSIDPDGIIVRYAWDFGDGSTGTGAVVPHTYSSPNVYNVVLAVTDNDSLTSICTTVALIGNLSPVEISSFGAIATRPTAVEVTWRFRPSEDLLGFELWRRAGASPEVKLHDGLLDDPDRNGEIHFTDQRVEPGGHYDYTLVVVDLSGARERMGPVAVEVPLPALGLRIAPNPSRPPIAVRADLPQAGSVKVWVADATGRIVRTIVDEPRAAGLHALTWDGRDGRGVAVASGIYFTVLEQGSEVRREKLVLVR